MQNRKLYKFEIIHSKEDMGNLAVRDQDELIDDRTRKQWYFIKEYIDSLKLDFSKVKVYQDGLPKGNASKTLKKVQSPNYDFLRELKKNGAKIIGTENPTLLGEEFNFIKEIKDASDKEAKQKAFEVYLQRLPSLLEERDAYMAQRVLETLKEGETGIMFVGLAHKIGDQLQRRGVEIIEVQNYWGEKEFGRGLTKEGRNWGEKKE